MRTSNSFIFAIITLAVVLSCSIAGANMIAHPTLEDLVLDSDLIAVGDVLFVFPTFAMIAFYVFCAVFIRALFLQFVKKKKPKPSFIELLPILVAVIIFSAAGGFPPYRKVALFSVSEVIHGEINGRIKLVYHDTPSAFDETGLKIGGNYLLFMRKINVGYKTSWGDSGRWNITGDRIAVSYTELLDKDEKWNIMLEEEKPLNETIAMVKDFKKKTDDIKAFGKCSSFLREIVRAELRYREDHRSFATDITTLTNTYMLEDCDPEKEDCQDKLTKRLEESCVPESLNIEEKKRFEITISAKAKDTDNCAICLVYGSHDEAIFPRHYSQCSNDMICPVLPQTRY